MKVTYDKKSDLLYIRLDESRQDVINKRVADDVVLDIGKGDKIVGIEILEASSHVDLARYCLSSTKVSKSPHSFPYLRAYELSRFHTQFSSLTPTTYTIICYNQTVIMGT